jgi:2-(1,2-epoxy-1,2-dihydrophenyl)acetyl-CoA isomerase
MIYKVFPDEQFNAESMKLAMTLAKMPTMGLAYTKKLLSASITNTFEEQLKEEDIYQQRAAQTEDYREGVAGFMEKRIPNFKGS